MDRGIIMCDSDAQLQLQLQCMHAGMRRNRIHREAAVVTQAPAACSDSDTLAI